MAERCDLVLSPEEIYAITHYKLPQKQLTALAELGISAQLRKIDNTVCVLRMHVTTSAASSPLLRATPVRKSARERAGS